MPIDTRDRALHPFASLVPLNWIRLDCWLKTQKILMRLTCHRSAKPLEACSVRNSKARVSAVTSRDLACDRNSNRCRRRRE